MSIWTSKGLLALAVVGVLGGCAALPQGQAAPAPKVSLTETTVGRLQARAPAGYCVDHASASATSAVMFPCRALGVEKFDWPEPVVVLTTSVGGKVGRETLGSSEQLERFFKSHWRAVTVIDGRAVTMTAGGYGKNQVEEKTGLKILQQYVTQLRTVNSQKDADTEKKGLLASLR